MYSDDSDGSSHGYVSDFLSSPSSSSEINVINSGEPLIEIVEEPGDYRYRYEKERYHGYLLAVKSPSTKKKDACIFPKVKVRNYFSDVIIRCWLITTDLNGHPKPHFHKLCRKVNKLQPKSEPLDLFATNKNGYEVVFDHMYIVHAVEKSDNDLIIYKNKKTWLCEGSYDQPAARKHDYVLKDDLKQMDKNQSVLLFQAFDAVTKKNICPAVISRTIKNLHNAENAPLKIVNYSQTSGSCKGDEEIFMLVEKISKDVEVLFYTSENGKRTWEAKGIFGPHNVHHQVAIVFRTPPYQDTRIIKPVPVYVELHRTTDGSKSPPVKFTYKPDDWFNQNDFTLKRPRSHSPALIFKCDPFLSCEEESCKKKRDDILPDVLGEYLNNLSSEQMINFDGDQCDLLEDPIYFQCADPIPVGSYVLGNIFPEDNQIMTDSVSDHNTTKLLVKPNAYHETNIEILHNLSKIIMNSKEFNLTDFERKIQSFDINTVDFGGNTIFLIACVHSKEAVLRLLNMPSVDRNITNFSGDNALLCAIRAEAFDTSEELLKNRFDPNTQNYKSGETPLHVAVSSGNMHLVKLLIKFGSNPIMVNYANLSPLDYVDSLENSELQDYLFLKIKESFQINDITVDEESDLSSKLEKVSVS